MEPRFSIIIPTYNRLVSLTNAINSVLSQEGTVFELIVIDDGSNDGTRDEIEGKNQILYFYQKNTGVSAARNFGAKIANFEWLVFLDSDDELLPNSLLTFKNTILLHKDIQVVKARFYLHKKNVNVGASGGLGKANIPGSFTIKRKYFEKVGKFDEKLMFAENTELMFRISQKGIKSVQIEEIVLKYNQSSEGGSQNLLNMRDSLSYILDKHHGKLTNHVLHLYNQNLGVIWLRYLNLKLARKYLFRAYLLKPWKFKTLARLGLSFMPSLSKKIYTTNISE